MKTRIFAGALVLAWVTCLPRIAVAEGQVRVACAGEQSTHSAHRTNDPEYPLLMGQFLDGDFVAGPGMAPYGGGFLEGGGTHFEVGNFGHPQGTVINHDLVDPKTYLKSQEYQLLVAFKPNLIVLGPFGYHEPQTGKPITNFPGDMKTLLDALLAIDSGPRVALVTPLPESGVDKHDTFDNVLQYTLAAAEDYKLPVIDLWTSFLGQGSLYVDDFHLTLEGRTRHAKVVADAVRTLSAEPPGGGGMGGAGGMSGGENTGGALGGAGGASGGGSGGDARAGSPSTAMGGSAVAGSGGAAAPDSAGATSGNGGGSTSSTLITAAPTTSTGASCGYAPGGAPAKGSTGATFIVLAFAASSRRRSKR